MKVLKKEKEDVIWWVEQQFNQNPAFPSRCVSKKSGKVTDKHLKAYKAWGKVGTKRSRIVEWLDDWLSEDEYAAMQQTVRQRQSHRSSEQ